MSYTKHFTASDVRANLVRIVQRFGHDHKAQTPEGGQGCIYATVSEGRLVAVCIIGQLIADLGYLGALLTAEPYFFEDGEPDQRDACSFGAALWDDLAGVGITFSDEAKSYARLVQAAQDAGRTWSQAVRYGDAAFAESARHDALEALGLPRPWGGVNSEDFESAPL
jgi:hypothetical protein